MAAYAGCKWIKRQPNTKIKGQDLSKPLESILFPQARSEVVVLRGDI